MYVAGATQQEEVTDQYLPEMIKNITPKSSGDAVCKKLYFETDKITNANVSIGKIGDFIQAHIPEGEGKCSIVDIMLMLRMKDKSNAATETEVVRKIFSCPEKWDVENA